MIVATGVLGGGPGRRGWGHCRELAAPLPVLMGCWPRGGEVGPAVRTQDRTSARPSHIPMCELVHFPRDTAGVKSLLFCLHSAVRSSEAASGLSPCSSTSTSSTSGPALQAARGCKNQADAHVSSTQPQALCWLRGPTAGHLWHIAVGASSPWRRQQPQLPSAQV